ncbi:MAG: S8 family serine peptidase [Oligoflexia bacterium]|nr:S8 family serine peptidase [Oligoflexia bacterium]
MKNTVKITISILSLFLLFSTTLYSKDLKTVEIVSDGKKAQIKNEYIVKVKINKDNSSASNSDNKDNNKNLLPLIKVESFFRTDQKSLPSITTITPTTPPTPPYVRERKILHRLGLQDIKSTLHVKLGERDIEDFKKQMQNEIEYIEPNYIVKEFTDTTTTDNNTTTTDNSTSNLTIPLNQWGLKNSNNIDIGAKKAWEITAGRKDVVVAIIDSGVDYNHEALKHAIWSNKKEIANNEIDDDKNGFIDDVRGWDFYEDSNQPYDETAHGTHCAGIVAAKSKVAMGIAPNVSVMPLRFIGPDGNGASSDAIRAIEYAVKMKVNVISSSWGGYGFSRAMKAAITSARDAGILFIAAAGNEKTYTDEEPFYPANYDLENIISVGAVNKYGNLCSFSNYGAKSVHLAAPGSSILSSIPDNDYDYFNGTSMACPYVSGVASLVISAKPNLNWKEVRNILFNSVTKLDSLKGITTTSGMVNAYNALNLALGNNPTPITPIITTPTPSTPTPTPIVTPTPTPKPYFDASKVKLEVYKKRVLIKLKRVTLYLDVDEKELSKIAQVTYIIQDSNKNPMTVFNSEEYFPYSYLTYKDEQTITYIVELKNGQELTFTEDI